LPVKCVKVGHRVYPMAVYDKTDERPYLVAALDKSRALFSRAVNVGPVDVLSLGKQVVGKQCRKIVLHLRAADVRPVQCARFFGAGAHRRHNNITNYVDLAFTALGPWRVMRISIIHQNSSGSAYLIDAHPTRLYRDSTFCRTTRQAPTGAQVS
jgi:hypothetical protein